MVDETPMIKERLARWNAFVEQGNGPFMFHVNASEPESESQLPPDPPLWPEMADARIERRWSEYQLMSRRAKRVRDDRIPFISNLTGTEIFAEAFGCNVYRPDDTKPFALPMVHSAAEAERVKVPELSTSSLAYLFGMADELYRRGGPSVVMKPVDIQSPMDIVALIWAKEDLFLAMIETPDVVRALADKVMIFLMSFFDEWRERYGTVFVAHYPDYVMHDGITISVDEVGALNPEMFQAFFRDELLTLSDHFGGLGIHCCADARHQWKNFRDLHGLKVMNHNAPPTRDAEQYLLDSVAFYGNAIAQVPVGWTPDGQPETWPSQFPEGARLVYEVPAKDMLAAERIADRMQALREAINAGASDPQQVSIQR